MSVAGVHPAAEIFPLLTGVEADDLAADIKANGLKEPIVLTIDGLLLDGRNRLNACAAVDVAPRFETWDGVGSPVDYVVSKNLRRRHLDVGQRAMIAVDLIPLYEDEARERMLAGQEPPGDPGAKMRQGQRADKSAARAAAVVNVSSRSVETAKALATHAPDKAAEVRNGQKKLGRAAAELKRDQLRAAGPARFPDGVFPVVLVDPPWEYVHTETDNRRVDNHYPTMTAAELHAIEPPFADDAVVFMWATSPKLDEAFALLVAWGLTYVTCAVWVKDKIGMGYYFRQAHELLLVAKRGNPRTPDESTRRSSVFEAPRGRHSEKPAVVYEAIEAMYPDVPRLEMFARSHREGWAVYGNEV